MSETNNSLVRLAFIGCGNMGEALLARILASSIIPKEQITVTTKTVARREHIEKTHGVKVGSLVEATTNANIVILAIKPQHLGELPTIKLSPKTIVVSVLAGTPISKIKAHFPDARGVVRSMPNLGYAVGRGVTGLYFNAHTSWTASDKALLRQLFNSGGITLEVHGEKELDAITAISGSGPAYYFWFSEQLISAAQKLGISSTDAEVIVRETLVGASEVAKASPELDLAELRQRVTSKGGTTEAAIKVLSTSSVDQVLMKAVKAAERRAHNLSAER